MCLSCVGACPRAALADNPERPELRFIEANCVQCGLCATTCPEDAITLQPRLWLADGGKARAAPRVLHAAEPFACVRCGKPFGTLSAIEKITEKLAGKHWMFQTGEVVERIRTSRLVTVKGPGGIGKTRLAIEAARRLLPRLRPMEIDQ